MYCKVVYDGVVVDVLESIDYVTQNKRNLGIVGTGDCEKAMGILSSDSSVIWHVDGMDEFLSGDYQTVKLVQIDENEYREIKEKLNIGDKVVHEETLDNNGNVEVDKTPLFVEIMKKYESDIDSIILMMLEG